jgi:hypothetical protein
VGKLAILFFTAVLCGATAAENPQIEIANKQIHAKLYLPDEENGFCKAARFDWPGLIDIAADPGKEYVAVRS